MSDKRSQPWKSFENEASQVGFACYLAAMTWPSDEALSSCRGHGDVRCPSPLSASKQLTGRSLSSHSHNCKLSSWRSLIYSSGYSICSSLELINLARKTSFGRGYMHPTTLSSSSPCYQTYSITLIQYVYIASGKSIGCASMIHYGFIDVEKSIWAVPIAS